MMRDTTIELPYNPNIVYHTDMMLANASIALSIHGIYSYPQYSIYHMDMMSADASIALSIRCIYSYPQYSIYHMDVILADASFAFLIHGEGGSTLLPDLHYQPYEYHKYWLDPGWA